MKKLITSLLIGTVTLLFLGNSFAVDVNLFNQPQQNSNSCGIRQTLIATHVLKQGNIGVFTGDLIGTWNFYDTIFHREYGQYLGTESCNLPALFINKVPKSDSAQARAVVNGGPLTVPSALIKTAQGQQGLKALSVHIYKPFVDEFFGKVHVTEDTSFLEYEIQMYKELGLDVIMMTERLSYDNLPKDNAGKYYQLLINQGQHWIGTTTTKTYDSLTSGPTDFDPKKVFDAFAGLYIEYEYIQEGNINQL